MRHACQPPNGGSAPATLGFNAVAPEWCSYGAAGAAPAIPAAESTLGSHPCVALSSAQVLPGWTTSTPPCNDSSANGDDPLNFVSHSKGSVHRGTPPETPGPLSLALQIPERSSPSRVRCAAQNRRALDCSGPFRTTHSDKGKGADAKATPGSSSITKGDISIEAPRGTFLSRLDTILANSLQRSTPEGYTG
jgi:hypothetical protein